MKRLIVGSIEILSLVLIAIFLLIGLIGGYQSGDVLGAILGVIISFAFSVVIFGALFILLEMSDSLRAIRQLLEIQVKD